MADGTVTVEQARQRLDEAVAEMIYAHARKEPRAASAEFSASIDALIAAVRAEEKVSLECGAVDAEGYGCELARGHGGDHEALRGLRTYRQWPHVG